MTTTDSYESKLIPLGQLIDCPLNKRHVDPASPTIALLAASLKNGQEQDLIVRPAADGRYEVLDGKRRVTAARTRDDIPALWSQVREHCTDAQAQQIIIVTQLHRENLSPLEEAALVADLLASGLSQADAAAQLGQTPAWVARRAKLVDLDPAWRDGMEAGTYPWLTVGHLELIARLPTEVQRQMATDYAQAWKAPATLGDFDLEIREQYLHSLKHAPWKLDDLALLPAVGACTTCTKRSSCQQNLFSDIPDDAGRCLDAVCWSDKLTAHTASKARQLAEKNPALKVILLRDASASHPMPAPGRLPAQVVVIDHSYGLEKCRKADPGAMPTLHAETGEAGWMRPTPHIPADTRKALGLAAPTAGKPAGAPNQPAPTAEARRAAQRLALRLRILDEELPDSDMPKVDEVMALYATFVVGSFDPLTDTGWTEYQANLAKPAAEVAALLWDDFIRRLPLTRKVTARDMPDESAVSALESLATLDPAAQAAKVLAEIPEPQRKG